MDRRKTYSRFKRGAATNAIVSSHDRQHANGATPVALGSLVDDA